MKQNKTAQITQEQLSAGMSIAIKAVSPRTILPILGNIRLNFTKNRLELFATDLEVGIATKVDCVFCDDFATTVPAKLFLDLINTMPNQAISISYDETTHMMELNTNKSKQKVKCMPSDDFPAQHKFEKVLFKLPAFQWKETIERIAFSASDEETQPVLKSVIIKTGEDKIIIYALDGYRASARSLDMEGIAESLIIVPSSAVSTSTKILSDTEISVMANDKSVCFESGETSIYSQINAGNVPDFKLILEKASGIKQHTAKLNSAELTLACKQARIFAAMTNSEIVSVALSKNNVAISTASKASDTGESTSNVDAEIHGEDIKFGISVTYLTQFISIAKSPSLTMMAKNEKSPIVFYIEELSEYWHMIMPMTF